MTKPKPQARSRAPIAWPALPQQPAPALLSRDDLRELYGISYSRWHLQRLISLGRFPAPVALGSPELKFGRKVWRREAIEKWVAALQPADTTA